MAGKEAFQVWANNRLRSLRLSQALAIFAAVILSAGFQYGIYKTRSFEILAPNSISPNARIHWGYHAYHSWWASYNHVPGAVAFFLIAACGIFIVLTQNTVIMIMATAAAVIRCYAEPQVDWLNADGHYGWMSVERIFRASYLTTTLRGITISALIFGFGVRNTSLVVIVAVMWLCIVSFYHIIPYRTLFTYIGQAKEHRIRELVIERSKYTKKGRRGLETTRFYAEEIECVRSARINPMHLPRWQSSWFIASIMLPIILTIIQISL